MVHSNCLKLCAVLNLVDQQHSPNHTASPAPNIPVWRLHVPPPYVSNETDLMYMDEAADVDVAVPKHPISVCMTQGPFRSWSIKKSAHVNACFFSVLIISRLDSPSSRCLHYFLTTTLVNHALFSHFCHHQSLQQIKVHGSLSTGQSRLRPALNFPKEIYFVLSELADNIACRDLLEIHVKSWWKIAGQLLPCHGWIWRGWVRDGMHKWLISRQGLQLGYSCLDIVWLEVQKETKTPNATVL